MADKQEKAQPNWMRMAWVIAVGYLVIMGLILRDRLWDFFSQTTELNAIGDFLAGFFAFPAFVFLAAAVMTQRQELTEARKQFEDSSDVTQAQLGMIAKQNEIAENAARANYKLAMFDKRQEIYKGLLKSTLDIWTEGVKDQMLTALNLIDQAEFVFGVSAMEQLRGVKDKLERRRRIMAELVWISARLKRSSDVAEISDLTKKQTLLFHEMEEIDDWIMKEFVPIRIDEVIRPMLILPVDIVPSQDQQEFNTAI